MEKEIIKLKNQFFAACPTGLEELLASEIKELEYVKESLRVVKGGVHFEAFPQVALELVLCSRIASRIYRKTFQFDVLVEKDFYYRASEIKWKSLFDLDQTFKIGVVQGLSPNGEKRSAFQNTMFLAHNLKDGIVDRFRKDCKGERPSVDKDQPDVSILLRVEPHDDPDSKKELVTILIDLTGSPLSQRGYRDVNFTAPLKENLAAALVMFTGYTGNETFIDNMCGSGTLVIESMLIKGNIPPSYLALESIEAGDDHYWDFLKQAWFTKDKYLLENWDLLCKKYKKLAEDGFKSLETNTHRTIASDIAQSAVSTTNSNLKASRLKDFVILGKEDATKMKTNSEPGVILINPPYGERIGSEDDLEALYYEYGENLKNSFKGFRAYVFTGNLPLLKKISLRTSQKIILYNGNIDSRLAKYELY